MKCRSVETKSKNRIPEVGEVWKYKNTYNNTIYMRISDSPGRDIFDSIFNKQQLNEKFFSVDLLVGNIIYTSLDCDNIIILKPKQVVNGIIEFEPAD